MGNISNQLRPYSRYLIGALVLGAAAIGIAMYQSQPEYIQDNITDQIEKSAESQVDPTDPFGLRKQAKDMQEAEKEVAGMQFAGELSHNLTNDCPSCTPFMDQINFIVAQNNKLYKELQDKQEIYFKKMDALQVEFSEMIKLFDALELDEDGTVINGDLSAAKAEEQRIKTLRDEINNQTRQELRPLLDQMKQLRTNYDKAVLELSQCQQSTDQCGKSIQVETKTQFKIKKDGKEINL